MGLSTSPPPPRPNPKSGEVLVQGAQVREPRFMYHGTHVANISQHYPSRLDNTKQQASIHRRTQEHIEVQLHFATHVDALCSLCKVTNHILYWIGTPHMMVPKTPPKSVETRGRCVWTSPC